MGSTRATIPGTGRPRMVGQRQGASLLCIGVLAIWSLTSLDVFVEIASAGRPRKAIASTLQRRATKGQEIMESESAKKRMEMEKQRQVFLELDEEEFAIDIRKRVMIAEKVKAEVEARQNSPWFLLGNEASKPIGIIVGFFVISAIAYWIFFTEEGADYFYWGPNDERIRKLKAALGEDDSTILLNDFRNLDKATVKATLQKMQEMREAAKAQKAAAAAGSG